jgi:catechol 2,3-dioxygenase-like lactoylglutathione lyase family enzyme
MERFVENLVCDLERGAIDRRQFCETIALAATVLACGGAAAETAGGEGFKAIGINHISYACADYRKARDFYTSVFGMETVPGSDNGREARLMFGPPPGKGGSFLIPRNASTTPKASAVIDHICFTIRDWDEGKVRAAMKAKGYDKLTGRDGSLHVYDPFGFDVQFANAEQENAFRHKA